MASSYHTAADTDARSSQGALLGGTVLSEGQAGCRLQAALGLSVCVNGLRGTQPRCGQMYRQWVRSTPRRQSPAPDSARFPEPEILTFWIFAEKKVPIPALNQQLFIHQLVLQSSCCVPGHLPRAGHTVTSAVDGFSRSQRLRPVGEKTFHALNFSHESP